MAELTARIAATRSGDSKLRICAFMRRRSNESCKRESFGRMHDTVRGAVTRAVKRSEGLRERKVELRRDGYILSGSSNGCSAWAVATYR